MQMIVVVEFESTDAAQHSYHAPEYADIKHLHTSATEGWVSIAKEFVASEE